MKWPCRSVVLVRAIPLASVLSALTLSTPSSSAAAALAFPGAEGFGASVTGGRGGQVVHVTTLSDSGAGSLRDAVSQGNRIVVFDIGGVVTITSPLVLAGDNLTLCGQTAPGPGITVYGDGTSASNRKNIIIRYMRFRQGIDSDSGTKALNVTDGSQMIFDHISVQWGRWDTIGLTGTTSTITIQYSLMGESIDPQRFGGLVDSANEITLSHNLWLDSQSRSPKFKANGQYIDNVVYNWGANGLGGGHSGADWYEDLINNIFIKGPSSTGGFATGYASTDHVFNTGNLADLDLDGKLSGRAVVTTDFQGDTPPTFETAAHNPSPVPVTLESATAAYGDVIATAGASLCRDPVDVRLVNQVASLGAKGAIVVNESLVGGQPAEAPVTRPSGFDSDGDGMPDAWETAHGLNPKSAADGTSDSTGDGYVNIEKYVNELSQAPPGSCGTALADAGTSVQDAALGTGSASDAAAPEMPVTSDAGGTTIDAPNAGATSDIDVGAAGAPPGGSATDAGEGAKDPAKDDAVPPAGCSCRMVAVDERGVQAPSLAWAAALALLAATRLRFTSDRA